MGRQRAARGRAVDGVVLLDKPAGWTSNAALQAVKRLFQARKAGHTGSLDPLASGLLPVCLGEATKVSAFLLDADKHYRVTAALGVKTTTGDADGEVVARADPPTFDQGRVLEALRALTGEIEQVPPMHSAIKHHGKRLYELARAGVEVERAPRTVRIHALELLGVADDGALTLDVRCSKGTYVRTLVEDVADRLGTYAHVTALRRLGAGPYGEAGMVGLPALESLADAGLAALDAVLLPMDTAAAQWPAVHVGADSAHYLLQGQPVMVPRAPTAGWVRLYTEGTRFLGMGRITEEGLVAPKRLVQTETPRRLLAAGGTE
jgi:tRNA pseudouridine55 synthase